MATLELVAPNAALLPSYADALRAGTHHSPVPTSEQLKAIGRDADAFLAELADPSRARRRGHDPSLRRMFRWLSDGEFAGEFVVRWHPDRPDLANPALGHVGYGIVETKRRRGYATAGLGLLLDQLRREPIGLDYLDITTSADNVASQKVILANGASLVDQFERSPLHQGRRALRYRVSLSD